MHAGPDGEPDAERTARDAESAGQRAGRCMLLRMPKRLANDWNAQREHDHDDNDETQADLRRP